MVRLLRRAGLGVLILAAAATGAVAETFSFDWPVPGMAVVTVDQLKRERAARYLYVLTTEQAPEGGAMLVHSGHFQPLVFDGRPIDTPAERAAVAPALAVAAAVPSLRIGPDGTFAGFEGDFEAMFDRLRETFGDNPQAIRTMQAIRDSQQMRNAATLKAVDVWSTWVGTWIGLSLDEGETREGETEVESFGRTFRQRTTLRHGGPSDACPGCVVLLWEGVLDDPAFLRGWAETMRSLAAQGGSAAGLEEFLTRVERIRRVATIRLETDPATLKPHVVVRENTVFMQVGDGPEARQVERTRYRFDWQER